VLGSLLGVDTTDGSLVGIKLVVGIKLGDKVGSTDGARVSRGEGGQRALGLLHLCCSDFMIATVM
jgi:hypothetical protein